MNGSLLDNKYVIIFIVIIVILGVICSFSNFCSLKKNLRKSACYSMQIQIERSIKNYNRDHKGREFKVGKDNVIDQFKLLDEGYLRKKMICPDNGKFYLNKKGYVYCNKHNKRVK